MSRCLEYGYTHDGFTVHAVVRRALTQSYPDDRSEIMNGSNTGTQAPIGRQQLRYGRKRFITGVIAGAVAVAMGGVVLGPTNQAMATLSSPITFQGSTSVSMPNFADIAERVTPAVVNVTVASSGGNAVPRSEKQEDFPQDGPFGEFFRRYFDEKSQRSPGFGESPGRVGHGSGFIVDPEGYIVTNHHVVAGAEEVEVRLHNGARYSAKVKGADPKTDLALLKIAGKKPFPFVELGGSDEARVGDWVLAVGNPFGLGGSVSAGIISARGRDIQSGPYDDYLQIDAPINRGNSGGPLFNPAGRVIGVNTAIYSPSGGSVGIGFAIPSSTVKGVIAALKEHGRVERGWLGVQIQSVTDDIATALGRENQQGALVAEVMEKSPAAKAGLKVGDLILAVDGRPVNVMKDLPKMIADTRPEARVDLSVQRKGSRQSIDMIIGAMPSDQTVSAVENAGGKGTEPRLGLYLAPLTPDTLKEQNLHKDTRGVLIARVEKGSAAEKAGIRPGSLITMVGQQEVSSPAEAVSRVRKALQDGDRMLLLRVLKDGRSMFVAVELTA
ncbi:MAG: DegQ family serine endoprotease [Gammaproteobacteria bacterium]|nr:DegQ family serine endoprotease [Gammaproteobacteria bacterium]